MKNKKEKTLLILQLHTKKNITTTCAPVQLQNELRKKQQQKQKN